MIPALTIIDDLLSLEKATEVRQKALEAGFKDVFYMQGKYQGTGMDYLPDEIPIALSQFVGRPIDVKIAAFRLGHEKTELHVNIHADNPISDYASVMYFNRPEECKGGTAFYTLKETGWNTMPTQEVLDSSGYSLDWLRNKWQQEDAWDRHTIAGMKFNRMIFYPSQYFHSRFPLQGWGEESEPERARLVHTMFFNIK